MNKTAVTAIFFSCKRVHLLKRTVDAFLQHNTYPIAEYVIVNDSADPIIHDEIRKLYPNFTLVLNRENVGLFKSIDLGLERVKTEYYFLCEDDWMITKGGFIENSLAIMLNHPEIEEVWLRQTLNTHSTENEIYESNGVRYKLALENVNKDVDGYDEGWHGFTTACALKRMSDYKRVAPYYNIHYHGSWNSTVTAWHKEYAIGLKYHKLGYRTAVLIDDEYAVNIGIGQSEYVFGKPQKI